MPSMAVNWRSAIFPYVKSSQIYECPSRKSAHDTTAAVAGGPSWLPSAYSANDGDNGQSPFCGSSSQPNEWRCDRGYRTVWRNKNADNTPVAVAAIPWPSQLIELQEYYHGGNSFPYARHPMESNSSDANAQGLWAGHLQTSNYLFADGHVKALKPLATATPVDLWGWNDYRTTPVAAYPGLITDSSNGLALVLGNSFLYH
jgi:prepilin-type processing-associated H-X9-DG protein